MKAASKSVLVVEHHGRGLDDRGCSGLTAEVLITAAAEAAGQQPHAALGLERVVGGPQDVEVRGWSGAPSRQASLPSSRNGSWA